jgi:hypothetical protein
LLDLNSSACGSSEPVRLFGSLVSSEVVGVTSSRIYAFGAALQLNPDIQSFQMCFCPDYESFANGSRTRGPSSFIFSRAVGILIHLDAVTYQPDSRNASGIIPGAKFDLSIMCGTGGCSRTGSTRLKLVKPSLANRVCTHIESAGCRSALQSMSVIGPTNCVGSPSHQFEWKSRGI